MPDKKIYVEGIAQAITLRRNTRIKRLSVKIGTHSGVVLCVPYAISESRAIRFLQQHKAWLNRHLQSDKYKLQEIPNKIILATATVFFQETEHNISQIKSEKQNIIVTVPRKLIFEKKEHLKRMQLEKVLRAEAKKFLPQRVQEIAQEKGFHYKSVSVRNQKTRWGSCSFHNSISLNIQLMRLPLHLIDYVIIHELCHTVHKNHSAKFWQLAAAKTGHSIYNCKQEMRFQRIRI